MHAHATPLTGGLAIYIATMVVLLVNFHFSIELKAIVFSSSLIFFMGMADDKFGLPAAFRLLVQIAASMILIVFGVHISFIPDFLGGIYVESILTMIWIVGITNSMNFIDGMDGIAAGTCIIYATFFAVIAGILRQHYFMFMAIAIAGSCLGFLPFNFRRGKPARIFLGDGGATFLGFLLASFAILGEWGPSFIDLAIPVLVMSVLIFDMCLTTIVRIYNREVTTFGEWLHFTGRDHFHHRLKDLGIDQRNAAYIFFAVSICFGLMAMAVLFANQLTAILILAHSALVFILMGYILVLRTGGKSPAPGKKELPPVKDVVCTQ